ncbi:jg25888 [Pararge aegeria aegeria]|uniref:Jg25888 protein n=1 Tax=Pararge aegeria aegeria TaxID=348720 RepID=A0A8S4RRR6_9NEOP|nr:jg25888 [Pararge aegeria aegeria]
MSLSESWTWSLASADGLLTENERFLLHDVDLFKTDEDLLKSFPSAAPKIDFNKLLQDDTSNTMYPPSPPDTKPSRAELANDLLQQLETQCKQGMYPNISSNSYTCLPECWPAWWTPDLTLIAEGDPCPVSC